MSDRELKYTAYSRYANYIETGDDLLSARDAAEILSCKGGTRLNGKKIQIKVLEPNQQDMVKRLRQFAKESL